jgi:hypothetical protein
MKRAILVALALGLALPAAVAGAKVSEEEAARLGTELTPVGANPNGNEDESIPPWTGGLVTPPPGWSLERRADPFADDPVRFTIDASNVADYADRLSPGQVALIEAYPGYRMDVYPTRRSCGYADWIYAATRKNAVTAQLDEDDVHLEKGWHPFLFPIPRNGAEAIWNHQYEPSSGGAIAHAASMTPTKSGNMTPTRVRVTTDARMSRKTTTSLDEAQGRAASMVVQVKAPPKRAGAVLLIHAMVNDQRRAWAYLPGQRRVRSVPTGGYDNPLPNNENLMTTDQERMFNGIIDRFDWKLVGKRELYVPYNIHALNHRPGLTYEEALGPRYVRRDLIRYELHRVWVVEATLKEGKRHLFGKRVFYLDEDSWKVVVEDIYDSRGNLWRVMEGMLTALPEVPTCTYEGVFSYDLSAGRYVAAGIRTEEPPTDYLAGRFDRVPKGIFTPHALRRMGRR